MTLLLAEGFDDLGSVSDKYTIGTSGATLDSTIRRFDIGKSLKLNSSSEVTLTSYLTDGETNLLYIGLAIYVEVSSYIYNIIDFRGYANGKILGINLTNLNEFTLVDANADTVFQFSYPYRTWFYLEIKVQSVYSSLAGDIQLRLNGTEIYNCGAGEVFGASGYDGYEMFIELSGYNTYIDDLYICDSNGTTNNTFLGPVKIKTLFPTGNGNSSQFDGSDGNSTDNYLLVDETDQDGDTTYVESATVDEVDLYTFDDETAFDDIFGVSVSVRSKLTTVGLRTGKSVCRSNSVNYEGDEIFNDVSYLVAENIWETDPATSSPWTTTSLNAAEFGVKVET